MQQSCQKNGTPWIGALLRHFPNVQCYALAPADKTWCKLFGAGPGAGPGEGPGVNLILKIRAFASTCA